jgi:formylglycine-generating enzyme required for sulfatase activity
LALEGLAAAAEAPAPGGPAAPAYPLWDGQESIAQYARRANLPPTQTLDLGNGVKLELVLIPAGKFTMGTPEPVPVDEDAFYDKMRLGALAVAVGAGALLVLLAVVVIRAIRQRRRPQYSLARFLVMTIAASVGLLGGLHWRFSARALSDAKVEHQAALPRYEAADSDEKPAHEVTLTKPFYVGKFEVTQEQYQQVMDDNPSHFKGRDLPVEMVSWEDAQAFCKKASEVARSTGSRGDPEGRPTVIRLPTDAEWEHSCRAGTKTTYCTGDTHGDRDRTAWYYENSNNTTHPVGEKTPNAWGVHDMHGNVWEWCQDLYDRYKAEAVVNPQGPAEGARRVLRGGSWGYAPGNCRSADRFGSHPDSRGDFVGFRVVVVPGTP